jgi:hypothetical protein
MTVEWDEFIGTLDGNLTSDEMKRLWDLINDVAERRLREKFGGSGDER